MVDPSQKPVCGADSVVRVLVADDEDGFLGLFRMMLAGISKLEIVGEASDGRATLEAIEDLHPDVVITDMNMPGASGLDIVRDVALHHPDIDVILVSGYSDREYETLALSEGALAFIPKTRLSPESILDALKLE